MNNQTPGADKLTDLGFRQARELLAMIEESTAQEVLVEIGDLTVHVVRPDSPVPTAVAAAVPAVATVTESPSTEVDAAPTSTGGVEVVAPTAGVFYRAPSPTEPPFVEAGASVTAGQVIGIIEVMKLLTHVVAPVDGVLVSFSAQNAAAVPFEHVLATIDPQ